MSFSSSKRNRGVNSKQSSRKDNKRQANLYIVSDDTPSVPPRNNFKPVQPKNYIQGVYLEAIKQNDIVFAKGPAGTGKTFIPAKYASEELFFKRINKIVITRPNVEAGQSLGFLPGELEEKFAPYLRPFEDVFRKDFGDSFYEYLLKTKQIEAIPIGFMRGMTLEDCVVLVDESQNVDSKCLELIVSRIGNNCKMIFSGDTKQKDIEGESGLEDAIKTLQGIEGIEVVEFRVEDCVRSKMCRRIISAYADK